MVPTILSFEFILKLPGTVPSITRPFCKREPKTKYTYVRRLPYQTASCFNLDFVAKELEIGQFFVPRIECVGVSLLVKILNYV